MVEQILQADPVWSAYALADLQPEFAPHCRWFPVRDEGVVLLYDGLTPTVLFAMGSAEIVGEALDKMPLPERVYIHVREHHLALLEHDYDFGSDVRPMLRLSMVNSEIAARAEGMNAVRLSPEDGLRVHRLYEHGGLFTPEFFSADQIAIGIFYGTYAESELVAVGGTHVLDLTRGVAAIGNMYTHPEHRGQGHATAILAALVREFLRCRIETVAMNVDQRNTTARHLYEQLGFEVYCPYFEGIGKMARA